MADKKDKKKNNGNQNGDAGQADDDQSQQQQDGDKEVTMTQQALDKLFKDRADRAARSAVSTLLDDLGFDDTGALKADLIEYKKVKDSQKSELEKLQDDLTASEKKVTDLEGEIADATDGLTELQMKTAVIAAAQDNHFLKESWDDIWLLVTNTEALKDKVKLEGDNVEGASAVVKEVAKLRPHWVQAKSKQGTPSGRGAQGSSAGRRNQKQQESSEDEEPLVRF